MKKLGILITSLLLTFSIIGLVACNVDALPDVDDSGANSSSISDSSSSELPEVFLLSFDGGVGSGTAPAPYQLIAGASIELPENTFVYDGYYFTGWLYGEDLYAEGETFIMPASAVIMVAQWEVIPEDPNPSFTAEEYEYDKLGGSALELPMELDGAGLFYVEVNGEFLAPNLYHYDAETKCLVIDANYVLSLSIGAHEVLAITDAETEVPVKCKINVTQSLKTTFDSQTTKSVVYGKETGVTFSVGYNTTVPTKLMQGDKVIDAKYYSYDDSSFTLSAEWISHFSNPTTYSLYLSNNDVYQFTVTNNIIFATDYDVVTEHDSTKSNIGHNPMYQYFDNVSIVEGPEGMSGKVLKITPNTVDVTYDCNGYLTLRRDDWDVTWRKGGFVEGKYYAISFDYMTEGTSVGEFYYGSAGNTSARRDLLLGEENDGVVRHFVMTVSYDDIKNGLFLWAKFNGGGGNVYVDNFKIAQLDSVPSLSANGEYNLIGDYSFNFDAAGLAYTVELDGKAIETVYDATAKTLTIKAEIAEKLESGTHPLVVKTAIGEYTAILRIVDNRVAELTDVYASFHTFKDSEVALAGSFTEGLKIVSLKVKDKTYDNGYSGGWDFYHANESAEYVEYATLVGGLNGTGKLILAGELIDMFWGETIFVAEFSNGVSVEFTVNNVDVLYSSNYDSLVMKGMLNGGFNAGSPLTSGMWGTTQAVEPRTDGKGNAFYFRGSRAGADKNAMTIRMTKHVWEWYTVLGNYDNLYRITFEYQISGHAQGSVYFEFIIPNGENPETSFFGNYDEVVQKADWKEVRYYLNADGGIHTFDSGWFKWNDVVRNIKIQLPDWAAADNKYFMLDEVRMVKTADILKNLGDYQIAQADEFGFVGDGSTVLSVKVDGNQIAYQVENGRVVLDKTALNALSTSTHVISVETALSTYKATFGVSDNRVANLHVTDLDVRYDQASAKLAGEFSENLSIVSIVRTGNDSVWDRNGNMNPAYITIEADGLVIGSEIINKQYRTGKYVVTFDNGKSVEFTLNGNILYYSDYDEVNVFVDIGGNSVICQDRAMIDFVENGNGNHAVRYTPANAVLGHSVGAMNNAGGDNIVFTFENRTRNNWNWYDLYFKAGDVVFVAFNYDIVTNGKESKYNFAWWDGTGAKHLIPLDGSGYFYMEFDATNLNAVGICAPVASPDLIRGTYMDIDNYAIGIHSDAYLTKYSANVVRGAGAVTLNGSFASDLTVTSVKRFGDNFWDNSKAAAIELGASAVTLSENGLTVSAEVVDKLYGTEIFHVTLSNGDVVRFTLTSNILHYTDYDLYSIHEASQGNIRSCQDTAMWEIVNVNGNNKIKYTPANAVYGHSANGAADNGCMTFSNTSLGNHWWWEFALDTSKTVMVFFDYEVVLGEGKTSYYMFDAICQDGSHIRTEITGSGTFYTEIDTTKVVGFRIYCPSGSNALITDTYMLIDNYGFGYKA